MQRTQQIPRSQCVRRQAHLSMSTRTAGTCIRPRSAAVQQVRSLLWDAQSMSTNANLTLDIGRPVLSANSQVLETHERMRLNNNDDAMFFDKPRMMQSVTPWFRSQLASAYSHYLFQFSKPVSVLDLCSSAHSHLPPLPSKSPFKFASPQSFNVLGHGMNAQELTANPQLDSWFIQDLNRRTLIDLPTASQHAVLCSGGFPYLQWPEEVAVEVLRVLRPGGVLLMSFGTDCWTEKATAGWLERGVEGRVELVEDVLTTAGFEHLTSTITYPDLPSRESGKASSGDVFCLVAAFHPACPLAPRADPGHTAKEMVPIALKELDHSLREARSVSKATLERWREGYRVLVEDARDLGIPAYAVPSLAPDADAAAIKGNRDHLRDMIASYLSAGL